MFVLFVASSLFVIVVLFVTFVLTTLAARQLEEHLVLVADELDQL